MDRKTPFHYWVGLIAGALCAAVGGWGYEYWEMRSAYAKMEGRLAAVFDEQQAERFVDGAMNDKPAYDYHEELSSLWSDARLEKLDAVGFAGPESLGSPYRDFQDHGYLVGLILALPGGLVGLLIATRFDRRIS